MADDNQLKVSVVAETSRFTPATNEAKAAVKDLAASVRGTSPAFIEMADAINATNNSLGAIDKTAQQATPKVQAAMTPLASFKPNMSAFNGASNALKAIEQSSVSAGHGTAGFYRELLVLGHELSMGNYKRFGGSMMVLAEQSGKLTEMFGMVRAVASPMNLAIAGTAAVLAAVVVSAGHAEAEMAKLRVAFAAVGNEHLFDPEKIEAMSDQLERLGGVGRKDALKMMTDLARSADLTAAEFDKIGPSANDLVAKFGSAETAGRGLAEAIDNPAGAIRQLHDEMARNSPSMLKTASDFIEMGDKASASRVLIDYLTQSAKGLSENGITPLGKAWRVVYNEIANVLSFTKGIDAMAFYVNKLATALNGVPKTFGPTLSADETAKIKDRNAALAAADDITRKLTADQKANNLASLQAGLKVAETGGDTSRINAFSAAIAKEQAKINATMAEADKKAAADRMQTWEGVLTSQLEGQKIYGDKARAVEITFWKQKLAVVAAGSADYRSITHKLYEVAPISWTVCGLVDYASASAVCMLAS